MAAFSVSHPVNWTPAASPRDVLPSVLHWSSADPVAVKVVFGDKTGIVEWVFSRDLLADVALGKYTEAGEGDVRVTRRVNHGQLSAPAGDLITLTLSVDIEAALHATLEDIRVFLEATFMYVKQGDEQIDLDATIGKILDEGQASGV